MPDKRLFPIHYLGKVYNTTIHRDLTDEEYRGIVDGIRRKPNEDEVIDQLKSIAAGGTRMDKVYSYFFKETAYKTKLIYNNWSIDEALRHKPLMEFFAGKVADNKKVYPDTMPLWKKVETAFRLCGFKTCSKPSNFPMKTIDALLDLYCPVGGNYLDYSCGWGVRLLSALKHNLNYYGIDPNDELYENLNRLCVMYGANIQCSSEVSIRHTGSEQFQPDMEGVIDFAFSSPPYFSLEDYRIGERQSYKEGTSYESWVENYVKPTVDNCYRYVKKDGIFGYNIKNNFKYIKYDMEGDWLSIVKAAGFVEYAEMPLTNITRVSGHKHEDTGNTMLKHDNDELIRLFKKV